MRTIIESAIPKVFNNKNTAGDGACQSVHGKWYYQVDGVLWGKNDGMNGYAHFKTLIKNSLSSGLIA